jgi:hypothetical protein
VVRIYAGGWTVDQLAAIQQELERRDVRYTMDADELLVDEHAERMVDMSGEAITET